MVELWTEMKEQTAHLKLPSLSLSILSCMLDSTS